MTGLNKSPRALALGAALADARNASGLTQRGAAEKFGVSQAVIGRIEAAGRTVTVDETAVLLGIYATPADEREHVIALARDVGRETWSATGAKSLPRSLAALVKYEQDAASITEINPLVIPGLLQTYDYAHAIMASGRLPAQEIQTRVANRMARQEVLRSRRPPNYTAIIDEFVLMRPAGAPEVMQHQALRLIEWSHRPHVDIRIIPKTVGLYPSLAGGYVIFEFDNGPPVVHLEHRGLGTWLHQQRDTAPQIESRSALLDITLGPDESRATIQAYT
ncbi:MULTISPECIES: helix-turn-helix domain-containing protein [Actinoalloteichus]|uniref:DNA binding protein with helix-turn-helix domain n=1 Tax=Actinoalloteichus fjordicus TaxID=1612552 RepID=A0AAC9PVF2_9PSEU|nr:MULTISPECIES: helix-turn-helix transcriptional regulator [Actinoalloteichus]APU17871.1 DNA binding protein with helix-turn-helix domain [Actinoalloteichus fjordicus]APU23949.1 DNA binding protein with helix-turn-helix domain [Actinoalloteichus sp. GBA129-24]